MSPPTAVALQKIQDGYRAFAPFYDVVFGPSLQHGRNAVLRALELRPGERVLEIGVGTGLSLPLYPEHVSVSGIDISREMLAKARARVEDRQLRHIEALTAMDAQALSFADGSFDKVAVMYVLSGLPDPLRAAREMMRVCRPGGTIVIANVFRSRGPLARACDGLLAPIYRRLHYRADLDLDDFVGASGLSVRAVRGANLFGRSTIVVCRNGG